MCVQSSIAHSTRNYSINGFNWTVPPGFKGKLSGDAGVTEDFLCLNAFPTFIMKCLLRDHRVIFLHFMALPKMVINCTHGQPPQCISHTRQRTSIVRWHKASVYQTITDKENEHWANLYFGNLYHSVFMIALGIINGYINNKIPPFSSRASSKDLSKN